MNRNKVIRTAALCAAVVVCLGLLVGASAPKEEPAPELKPVVVVNTASAVWKNLSVTGEFIGTVEPSQQVMVLPKASGEVLSVNFGVGDVVEEGDILFEIDSTAIRSNIAQTQAAVASAQAKASANLELAQQNLDSYNRGLEDGTNANVIAAEAAVKSAENRLETAQLNLSSANRALRDHRDLDEDEYVPLTGLDYDQMTRQYRDQVRQAQLAVESAEIALEQAQETLGATMAGIDDQATSIEANVKAAELNTNFSDQYIAIGQMQRNLADYTVKAPIAGVIEQRNVDIHDMASSQQAAFIISQKDAMTVTFQVAEETVASMQPGDKIRIEKDGKTWPGSIYEISTMVNARGGLYSVKASVEGAPFELHTGSTIKVIADTRKAENALTLPIGAVYFENGDAYVYGYRDGLLKRLPIETGITDNESIQVISGITAADAVVTTWSSGLRDGLEVVLAAEVDNLSPATMEYTEDGDEPAGNAGVPA